MRRFIRIPKEGFRSRMTLLDVPWEDVIFPKIFSFLSHRDLLNLMAASSRFADVVKEYIAQEKVLHGEMTPQDLIAFSKLTSNLRYLDLSFNRALKDCIFKKYIYNNRSIGTLDISFCPKLSKRGACCITSLKVSCLRVIGLEGVPSVNDEVIYTIAKNCADLDYIDIGRNSKIREEAVRTLVTSCKKLTDITVTGCGRLSEEFVEWLEIKF